MMQTNPRIPNTDKEVFAMAWMIGYIGWAPDELIEMFPNESFRDCPEFIPLDLAHFWRQGYDSGVAFFSDHALDEESE
jgi:hypothetical protein